jgi:hypothetical protein
MTTLFYNAFHASWRQPKNHQDGTRWSSSATELEFLEMVPQHKQKKICHKLPLNLGMFSLPTQKQPQNVLQTHFWSDDSQK